jgi:hypothetical protein
MNCKWKACYRGPRLYDTDATRAVVKKWVEFYRQHRAILDSDIIHVRRPDGQGIDCILHVNAQTKPRGLAMVYNSTEREVETTLRLPLYYTGLTETSRVREQDGKAREYRLDRAYNIEVPVKMAPKAITWFAVE